MVRGLSPCVRGNPVKNYSRAFWYGSIPVRTGEPHMLRIVD